MIKDRGGMGPGRWAGWLAVAALGGAASCTTAEKPASAPDTGADNGSPAVPAQKGPATAAGGMVKIPAGTFQMGAADLSEAEQPVHSATVAAFEMDKTEVTVAAYTACVTAGKCKKPTEGGACSYGKADHANHPINCVQWTDAKAYCAWTGKRLPTEEEWEYAARAGSEQRKFPWGNDQPASQVCWKADDTCEVGKYPAGQSKWGVLDMAGNVYEWTDSYWMDMYSNRREADGDSTRVQRGGSYGTTDGKQLRADRRVGQPEVNSRPGVGFRCAR